MKRVLMVSLVLAAFALSACGGMTVHTDWDENADFTSYKTFAWMSPPAGETHASELVMNRIRDSVIAEMKAKGYVEDEENPDIYVTSIVIIEQKTDVSTTSYGYGYGYGYWGGYGPQSVDVYQYHEGTILLDVVDAKKNQLVWRGSGSKVVDQSSGRPDKIRDAVINILSRFPPQ